MIVSGRGVLIVVWSVRSYPPHKRHFTYTRTINPSPSDDIGLVIGIALKNVSTRLWSVKSEFQGLFCLEYSLRLCFSPSNSQGMRPSAVGVLVIFKSVLLVSGCDGATYLKPCVWLWPRLETVRSRALTQRDCAALVPE